MNYFLEFIEPTRVMVVVTYVIALIFLKYNKADNKLMHTLLATCFLTEVLLSIVLHCGGNVSLFYTAAIILHHAIWLFIIMYKEYSVKAVGIVLAAFLIFSVANLTGLEGYEKFNYNTFIVGAFLYIIIYIYTCFNYLKSEKLTFFGTNYFVLISAPLFLLFGLSFIFGFKSNALGGSIIFRSTTLYEFIGYFVNFIYYSLINIYIYRENKLSHAG